MKTFIDGALRLVQEKEAENVQQVIKDLAEAQNLEHIRQLLETDLAYDGSLPTINFTTHAIPFLRIITNTEFTGSIVTEQYAGTIYNVVYGTQGSRGPRFFERLLSHSRTLMGLDPELYTEVFPMVISALRSTIQINSHSFVHDGIKQISRDALAQAKEQNLLVNPEMRYLHQNFKVINEQLKLGEKIPSLIPEKARGNGQIRGFAKTELHPAVQATIRLPGTRSDLGPRHDNDHASIADIRILPTAEEIRSVEAEYLPKMGGDSLYTDRSKRLLDSQFRLLREDNIGCLRESLRQIIENRANLDNLQRSKRKQNDGVKRFSSAGVAVLIHQNIKVEDISFSSTHGLKIGITFDQPIPNATARDRREWWANEKILDFSTLVCILNEENEATFFTVSDRFVTRNDIKGERNKDDHVSDANKPILTLSEDPNRAGIILSFADAVREKDVEWLYRLASSVCNSQIDLIEFPRTLLASFRPILQGLQKRINKTQAIPFIDWLAPDPSVDFQQDVEGRTKVAVRPPPYASKTGFYFELNSIFTEEAETPLHLLPESGYFDLERLMKNTTLDDGQARSLVKALSREVGLIQGPPGTGKSFVGTKLVKVLLSNKSRAPIGPIICVCYTNHALDQFLEHLLDIDVKNIIRLGSRSKSERLESCLLRNLSRDSHNTPLEKKAMWQLREEMRELNKEAGDYCRILSNSESEATFRSHLEDHHPIFHTRLFQEVEDEEGFIVMRGNGKEKPFTAWRKHAHPGSDGRPVTWLLAAGSQGIDPWTFNPAERFALLRFWTKEMVENATAGLAEVTRRHHEVSEKLSIVRKEWDKRALQGADIIGVTTTSLALHADLLERINAKVLFCEEAGEILEAHTITTLIPSIEHMILIGDHEQLRPHIANFDLSVESKKGQLYALDVSLFERLARQPYGILGLKFPIASLNTQRRMHPSIADLIRLKTYPSLMDKVPDYPRVPGMKKRLFWMDHKHPDSKGDAIRLTTSYDNEFEQEMVVGLVTHLLHQGVFKEKQIAVLTPYLGQMSKLRRLLSNTFDIVIGSRDQEALDAEAMLEDEEEEATGLKTAVHNTTVRKSTLAAAVRISTIDNFQGEEAEVVIISLVRSNKEGKCGFLKTSNRINVLLRECASDDILEFVVDMLMFETYRDSKDEPIIFLPCNHFYTVSTLDGMVSMKDFFELDTVVDWKIRKRYVQEKSEPKLPRCPKCRQPFTTSFRYNEIVKKAQLQDCIKQFTAASNDRLISLVRGVDIQQEILESSRDTFIPTTLAAIKIRYNELQMIRKRILDYNKYVLSEEQPYHRVYELTAFACRTHNIDQEEYNPSTVQYRFGIEGAYQELRATFLYVCDMDMISRRSTTSEDMTKKLKNRISPVLPPMPVKCDTLIKVCKNRRNQLLEIQARLVKARFRILILKSQDSEQAKEDQSETAVTKMEAAKENIRNDLEECLDICELIPSCRRLKGDVEDILKSLQDLTFYSTISDKELKEIYDSMAREFSGTGHWYRCPNGHQFTIADCGRAMQLGTCNECGAQIGGQNHQSAAGVRTDQDFDQRMINLG
ncbi:hypothetical protein H072_257 [Dactylellina haptotyla CBS 200.50]|uniref:RZ-type domain-containing protein n=1 Tax=Dactylellina haptotyla (strain CBS 200.50) TaxID=1284197 RepID=S8AS52_DACHA|nr:hypothetical protein H072_257 [Dactylellina haptotyla CBS 200.50]